MTSRTRRGLATWLTASETPLFVLDGRGVVLVFNHGCVQFTGWPASEVIGKTCRFQAQSDPTSLAALTAALCPPARIQEGNWGSVQTAIPKRDGTLEQRDIHFFPLASASDKDKGVVLGIITDVVESPPPRREPHTELTEHLTDLHRRYGVERMVARSPAMLRVAAQVELARGSDVPVHLWGEPGTGREHIARLIHYGGRRRSQRFVPLRCGASTHFELRRALERTLEAGEKSPVGTIYLDEVDRLPRDLQQLVLPEMTAGRGPRWMCSSNVLLDSVSEETMDRELRSRLATLSIFLPPLRQRLDDLPLLAQQLLEECNQDQESQHDGLTPAALRLLQQYRWPGNVDELARMIQKACERAQSGLVDVGDFPFELSAGMTGQETRPAPRSRSLDELLTEFEREQVARALRAAQGNKSAAADLLGIPRAKLYRRLQSLGFDTGEIDSADDPSDDSQ